MGSCTQQRLPAFCAFGWIKFALLSLIISVLFQAVLCEVEPTESQCRTYIEKALKEHHLDADEKILEDAASTQSLNEEEENFPTDEFTDSTEGSVTKDEVNDEDEADVEKDGDDDDDDNDDVKEQDNEAKTDSKGDKEEDNDNDSEEENPVIQSKYGEEDNENTDDNEKKDETERDEKDESTDVKEDEEKEENDEDDEDTISEDPIEVEVHEIELNDSDEEVTAEDKENEVSDVNKTDAENENDEEMEELNVKEQDDKEQEDVADQDDKEQEDTEDQDDKEQEDKEDQDDKEQEDKEDQEDKEEDDNEEDDKVEQNDKDKDQERLEKINSEDEKEKSEENDENELEKGKTNEKEIVEEKSQKEEKDEDETDTKKESEAEEEEKALNRDVRDLGTEYAAVKGAEEDDSAEEKVEEAPEEELIKEVVIPDNLRPRGHISKILNLEDTNLENILEKTIDTTLKTLKGLYDNAIKPLEMLYKYRDLSNRHFGDPEIFSKPLILFMGPWSGGKSSTINYLLDNEFSHTALRTGAEPSPAYFNILMYGEEEEILDGTQLAADWTFSGLQKFGQGLLDRLRGIKLPNKLLEKVNIVEIPGILEIRKQVQRMFPFNDACQWFIDRADIIFLVYDPSKLDVGPETEAILDQLKGREYQTRIILNKADQVKPEELMRVQGTLIWNISPLMSSSEPPIMYSTSLWSLPYETGAPIRLLQAQERAFLRDLREAIDKRVENKIASARRFAVRVRNHAKMVDCYLTTYYNHKTIFGNRKKISDDIIEYPQKYHIYEGLSTLTNISRYDLPDPDVYRDFFKINPLYDFKKLSETCTYFRGCPINKLDVAIAYDLPELVGKYKKAVEGAKEELQKKNS